MSPALMVIFAGTTASVSPAPTAPPVSLAVQVACPSQDPDKIVVCAQRAQPYRLDPSVSQAHAEAEMNARTATSTTPVAQAVCSASPAGCGLGLEGLDLANVAIVAGTAAVRAAKGKDWRSSFRAGGPDEYQLYQQAKQNREARLEERASAEAKRKAEEAERKAAGSN